MAMEEELDIRELINVLRKRAWIIVITTIVAILIAGIVSIFFLDDIYASSTTLIVSKQNSRSSGNDLQLSDINLARNLVGTYSVILKSNRVLERVISDLDLDIKTSELKSNIDVRSEGNTEIIRISVEDTISERARDIANTLSVVFKDEVKTLLNMDNVQVIDTARTSYSPIRPNVKKNVALALVVGLMVGIVIVFVIEFLDNTIKTSEDIQKYLGLPVIGMIPSFDSDESKR